MTMNLYMYIYIYYICAYVCIAYAWIYLYIGVYINIYIYVFNSVGMMIKTVIQVKRLILSIPIQLKHMAGQIGSSCQLLVGLNTRK